jgi:hypothetical protein
MKYQVRVIKRETPEVKTKDQVLMELRSKGFSPEVISSLAASPLFKAIHPLSPNYVEAK